MVKLAFWSNANKCGVTSNLAAISVASVIRFPYKIISLENHLSPHNLGCAYKGKPKADMIYEVGTNYYEGGGSEGLIRKIYRGCYGGNVLHDYAQEIINEHLYYIPQSQVIHSEQFDYEFNHCIHPIFQLIDEFAEVSLIDTASNNVLSSKTVLEEADLIVVNLYQDPVILKDFFSRYSSLLPKAIILISKYNRRFPFSMKRISKIYDFPLERIFPIPYNEVFGASVHLGSIVEFISSNYYCSRENPNYFFIQSIKRAAYGMMKAAQSITRERDEELKELELCGQ
ncbi:MAG: hypothetical protein GX359_04460 [Clostridiales bacterium]|nr:hypothetical protein [Clostridiales bacterium]